MAERVTVIIPTHNGRQWLERCLGSLMETEYAEMTVEAIDNASGDGSAELVEERFKRVKVLRLEKNIGFARAVNAGVRRALEGGAEAVVLLNQDTHVEKSWLKELMEKANGAGLGIASPMQLSYEGTTAEEDFGKLLAWHGYRTDKPAGPVLETGWVIGAAMMVRGEVFRRIGNFDENYFFYGEELDLCRRAVGAGFKVGVVTTSAIHHQGRPPGTSESPVRAYRKMLGDYIFLLKSPARPMWWLMGTWARAFTRDFWRGMACTRQGYMKNLLAAQWAVLRKLPAIRRRRRQERQCPHALR